MFRIFNSLIRYETFAETHHIVNFVPDPLIEFYDTVIGTSDLEVDFGAPLIVKKFFSFFHDESSDAGILMIRVNGKVVDPAPVAFIARHDGGDNPPAYAPDQEHLPLDFQFAVDIELGVVPLNHQTAIRP